MTTQSTNAAPKGPVTVLGLAYVGETLIARPNGVSDEDGMDYATFAYQWLRDGRAITGATGRTYEVSAEDVGAQLSLRFSYTDMGGTREVLTSDPEPAVPPAGTPLPGDDGPYNPFIVLGDAIVGETLTARPNAISDPLGIAAGSGSFQWLRDGVAIPGATGQTYMVGDADTDAALSVIYRYSDLRGTEKSVTSNPKPPTQPAPDAPVVIIDEGPETHLTGTAGADSLTAAPGLEQISGGAGTDTVVLAGDAAHYTLSLSRGGVTVSDGGQHGLGPITLDGVELIDFDQGIPGAGDVLDLRVYGGHATLDRATLETIIEVYIAYFDRAPDALGLGFWGTAVANGTTIGELAALFADQPETRGLYTREVSNAAFAGQVYDNVLGRAADGEGLAFWIEALNTGAVTRDAFILEVLEGAKSAFKPELGYDFIQQQFADRAYLADKVDIGAYFAVHKGLSDVGDAAAAMAIFDGSLGSLSAAVEAIDAAHEQALDPQDGSFVMPLVGVMDTPFGG